MTARTAARLAWSLWGLAMALEVAGILLWLPNHAALVDRFGTAQDSAPHVFLVPSYATVGAVAWPASYLFLGLLLLVFPDGWLPSGRWRPAAVVFMGRGVWECSTACSSRPPGPTTASRIPTPWPLRRSDIRPGGR